MKKHLIIFCCIILIQEATSTANCSTIDDVIDDDQIRNLTFPGGFLPSVANISWGTEEIGDKMISCVDKFVLLYELEEDVPLPKRLPLVALETDGQRPLSNGAKPEREGLLRALAKLDFNAFEIAAISDFATVKMDAFDNQSTFENLA